MRLIAFLLFSSSFYFTACDIKKKDPGIEIEKKKPLEEENRRNASNELKTNNTIYPNLQSNSQAEVLNNIIVHERGGLKAGRVFLAFEDGRLIPKTNKVKLGTPVFLVLVIDEGWTVENGIVSVEGSERIIASTGELVLNAPNLFKSSPAIKEADAKYINLKAVITNTRADIDHFIVNYRIWDKKGEGEIKGSYKLYIEDNE